MFEVIISGDDVPKKKPQPDAYLAALAVLGLPAAACLAIEDSRNGLMAAAGAGVPVLITRSLYFHDDDFAGAARVVDHLADQALDLSTVGASARQHAALFGEQANPDLRSPFDLAPDVR